MGRKTLTRLLVLLLTMALFAVACAEDEPEDVVSTETSSSAEQAEPEAEEEAEAVAEEEPEAVAEEEPEPEAEEVVEEAEEAEPAAELSPEVQWALDYTGGTAGAATGDPVVIGFNIFEDFFPTIRPAAEATAALINSELGGIDGRPLQIEFCNSNTPEAGATCAAEFANNDDLAAGLQFTILGNADFIDSLDGVKPIYTVGPLDVSDFGPRSTSYYTGALGAGVGLAFFSLSFEPESVAVLVTDDAGGRGGYSVFEPVIQGAGVELIPVFVPTTATAPEIEAALQAVDAANVDVLVVGLFDAGCVSAVDAMANIGIFGTGDSPVVMSPSTCYAPGVQAGLDAAGADYDIPNGWYFSHYGDNVFLPDLESGMATTRQIIEGALGEEDFGQVATEQGVGGVMTMAKLLNGLDGDYSYDAVQGALRSFEGPMMLQAGPIKCIDENPVFGGICASRVGIHRFLDGEWMEIAAGDNAIDIGPFLNPAG